MAGGYASMGGMHLPHAKPARRPKVRPPKAGHCKYCGHKVTPAQGSPMHQAQQMPPQAMMQPGAEMEGPPPQGPEPGEMPEMGG